MPKAGRFYKKSLFWLTVLEVQVQRAASDDAFLLSG